VQPVEELSIHKLTDEQIELPCNTPGQAAKDFVLFQGSLKTFEKLNIIIENKGTILLSLSEVYIKLAVGTIDHVSQRITNEAAKEASKANKIVLRNLK